MKPVWSKMTSLGGEGGPEELEPQGKRRSFSVSKAVQGDVDDASPWVRLLLGLCVYLCRCTRVG